MIKRKYPTLDEMIQSERREALIALRHLAGESIDTEPLWMRSTNGKPIITYHGALNVAQLLGIKRTSHTIRESTQRNGKTAYFATQTVRLNGSSRLGAAVSQNPLVACELAYRNAVKQII